MLDPKVNSLKKENESLKSEIAALKKNFEDFQNSLKRSVNDANVSNNGGEASWLAISQDETLNTLQFYGKSYDDLRQDADKNLQQLWSRLNVLSKRVGEIGKSLELIQRYSYLYKVKIVSLPEIKASESAFHTTILSLSLFQAAGVEISIQESILLIVLPPLADSGYMVEEDLNYRVTSFGKKRVYYTYKHSKLNEKFR